MDPELADEIGLSEKQRVQLRTINDAYQDKEEHLIYSDGVREGSPDLPKTLAAMERLYPEWNEAMARVLTAEQRHKLDAALGKPADVSRLRKEMEPVKGISK